MTTARRPPGPADLRFPQLAAHAPILSRRDGEWQVGVEPGQALVFSGAGIGAVLGLLDGRHAMPSILEHARLAGVRRAQLMAALTALTKAGLVQERDGSTSADQSRRGVRLVGAGPVGRQVADLLAGHGIGALYVFDDEPPDPVLYPTAGAASSRGQGLCSHLHDHHRAVATTVNHWSKPEAAAVDLTVIAADRPEVDRLLTEHLIRTDQPHLLVRCYGLGVSIGPLVQPGRTSCLRCADLARRDADTAWPTVLAQLTRIAQTPPPALVSWAAAVAAVQSLAFLGGALPETSGATLEINATDYAMRLRSWPPHPDCGCGWSTNTEWGHER